MSKQRGFTLIEVMVAFIIFAVASVSLMRSVTMTVNNVGRLEQATLAQWILENHYNELFITEQFPAVGESQKTVEMAGQSWRIKQVVKNTAQPTMRRIELTVAKVETGSVEARELASMASFLGKI